MQQKKKTLPSARGTRKGRKMGLLPAAGICVASLIALAGTNAAEGAPFPTARSLPYGPFMTDPPGLKTV